MSAAHSQIVTTPLASALALAEAGFWVFPLEPIANQPDRYRPFEKDWQAKATRDPAKIRDWWQSYPSRNIGIFTGKFRDDQALVVIDVDVRDGKPGRESLETLTDLGEPLPPTWEASTASGGRHIAFVVDEPLAGPSNWLGSKEAESGLDLRSSGNFIIAPGSVRKRGRYEVVNAIDPQPLPEWLRQHCTKARPRADQTPLVELDQPGALARAVDYLRQAPPAIQGHNGDDQTYKVAAQVKDMGVSEYQAQLLMLEHYDPRCVPPWGEEGIAAKVASAFAHGQNPPGSKVVTMDGFEPVPLSADQTTLAAAQKRVGFYTEMFDDIGPDLDQVHIVQGLLSPGAMSVLYGQSNVGKTFVAMDLAFHIAAGERWGDKRCEQGLVLYIAAEAGRSARNRVVALRRHYGKKAVPFALAPCPVDLFSSDESAAAIVREVRRLAEALGQAPIMIVIDTLSRALAGGNENSSEDMGAIVRSIDLIRTATGCHVMVVHHSGKDESKGARGHSLLRAATDTELEVTDGRITANKQRDMAPMAPIGFDLTVLNLGENRHGEAVTSCVVRLRDAAEGRVDGFDMEPREQLALTALQAALLQEGSKDETGRVSVNEKQWRLNLAKMDQTAFPEAVRFPKSEDGFRMAFNRARDRLAFAGRSVKIKEKQWGI